MGIEADQCIYISGNMFNEVPSSDAYFMKMILHDWDDKECLKILSNIHKSSAAQARLFVVEHIVPGPETPHFSKLFDVHMLCALTGRERTEEEYLSLLKQAGFNHVQTHFPRSKIMGVVEAVKA
jgi:tRNA G26 N,N-dimethylase Trm1